MAQFGVFIVNSVPPPGGTTHALVYRGDHVDEPAAVAAAAAALSLPDNKKVWAAPIASLTSYRVDVTTSRAVAVE